MGPRWATLGVLCPLLAAGCVTTHAPEPAPPRRVERPLLTAPAVADDLVFIDIAVLERPVGDFYVNSPLWKFADEQVIAPDRRAVIEDNGLRLGLIGGTLPAELQDLLGSKRSCPDPRRIQTHAGTVTSLNVGTTLPECQFGLHEDGKTTAVRLQQADCVLRVTPTFAEGAQTRLQVVPEVLHGGTTLLPRPAADRSGWELHQHRAAEGCPAAGWDVTLAPGQYLVIGGRFDRPDTLGHRMFIRPEPNPVQYVVILRGRPPAQPHRREDDGLSRQTPSLRGRQAPRWRNGCAGLCKLK